MYPFTKTGLNFEYKINIKIFEEFSTSIDIALK